VAQALLEKRLTEAAPSGGHRSRRHRRGDRRSAWLPGATILDSPAEAQFAGDVAQSLVGREHVVRDLEPSAGAEDFSFMLQVKPGAYMRLGQGEENGVGELPSWRNSRLTISTTRCYRWALRCTPASSSRACRWRLGLRRSACVRRLRFISRSSGRRFAPSAQAPHRWSGYR